MGCASPPPTYPIAERYSGDVAADPVRTQGLVTQTYAYWAALEDGRWHQAYRFHTLDFKAQFPFQGWLAQVRGGAFADRRPTVIRWSKGAHRYQGPELYAVTDWVAPDGRTGRIVWREVAPGRFEIETVEPI